jgi:2,3,4,5-tetrahydropyridine-2,6-dicarboxylate N-succinyltransferase
MLATKMNNSVMGQSSFSGQGGQVSDQQLLQLQGVIEQAWAKHQQGGDPASPQLAEALDFLLQGLQQGRVRVVQPPQIGQGTASPGQKRQDSQPQDSQPQGGHWQVNQWVKQGILLIFLTQRARGWASNSLFPTEAQPVQGPDLPGKPFAWWDKMGLLQRPAQDLQACGIRIVPGAFIRPGVCLERSTVVMPSAINIGAFIGAGSMVDYGACVGSCAYVGPRCHIAAGVTIGGVLEPVHSLPVIIEEGCFVGAGSHVLEGTHVEAGSVLAAGLVLTASTKIVHRSTGQILYGRVPAGSVVVPGAMADPKIPGLSLSCGVIIKQVDAGTRGKTAINELLRDEG